MKLVTFTHQNETSIGAVLGQDADQFVLDFKEVAGLPTDMTQLLRGGESALATAKLAVSNPIGLSLIPLADVTLLPPIPNPSKIICVGHNYREHMRVTSDAADYPVCFAKFPNVLVGHRQAIVYPRFAVHLDYEAEMAVVIGKRAKHVDLKDALDVVAGYTIFNDVTARDYQPRASQWSLRKSFDTFGPLGPALVTRDEIHDPNNLDLKLSVNGVQRQHSNTRYMIFSVDQLIAYLTRSMTLEPGDVIATGTPSGTGASLKPAVFMKIGDEVSIQIEKIGELVNPIVGG